MTEYGRVYIPATGEISKKKFKIIRRKPPTILIKINQRMSMDVVLKTSEKLIDVNQEPE